MTKNEKAKLRKLIKNHVNAQVRLSCAGSFPPAEAQELREAACKHELILDSFVKSIEVTP